MLVIGLQGSIQQTCSGKPARPFPRPSLPARASVLRCTPAPAISRTGLASVLPGLASTARVAQCKQADVKARAGPEGVEGDLGQDAVSLRRFGWVSFWSQLALAVVSSVVLFFTVTSNNRRALPAIPVYFTLMGVASSYISSFFAYGYTRVARRVLIEGERVKRSNVVSTILSTNVLNLIGIGTTLIGLQASVGQLVGKTLTSSTSNPYAAGAAVAKSTPTAIDVFSVQASTNTLMAHFVSIVFANWLLRLLNKGAPPVKGSPQFATKQNSQFST